MLLSDMRLRVSAEIGLDNTNGSQEQGFIDAWTNEAVAQFLEETKVYVASETIGPNLTQDYQMPTSILVINDIVVSTSDGQTIPLEQIDQEELIWRRRYPGALPIRMYAMQGQNLIMFYPAPGATDTATVYYVPVPTALAAGTDDIATVTKIPAIFHPILELYVKYKAGQYADDASSQNGLAYLQQFAAEVKKARGKIRRMQGRKRPPARAGRKARLKYYPAFPGQDIGSID